MPITIYTGQNVAKDCVVGDRLMNRYTVFNGLERPRRIDSNGNVTILGVDPPPAPTVALVGGVGSLGAGWYSWVIVYASSIYTRPVAVLDDSGNYTRGNPSPVASLNPGIATQVGVTVTATTQAGITHILIYRSLAAATQAQAEAGPFFLSQVVANASATIVDGRADAALGLAAETDNYPPNAYRYAVAAYNYVFMAGNFPIGSGLTCTMTPGSSLVTVDAGVPFYDGIRGWRFKCLLDSTGGTNNAGLYYANYVNGTTLQLIDASGNVINYDGSLTGSGHVFVVYLPGYALRWSKIGEPEAVPTLNNINFEGDITGIAQLPNQPILIVCTDEPSIYNLDLNLVGTESFRRNRTLVSTEHTASSHYSLCPVDGRLRGIDFFKSCIIETDGASVSDISGAFVPRIFEFLNDDMNDVRLWHCAYDQRQRMFGAFVTFRGAHRLIDFCIGQYTLTKGWFFHLEKDLLCTGDYIHPDTGETMVLGGTEGPGNDLGGVWGRIWCPNVYSEWIPTGCLLSGTLTNVVNAQTFDVDTSSGTFTTGGDGLVGRWVLVCDANGEYAQVGYIISNTASRLTVNRVLNGLNAYAFQPVPQVGWRFYLGLIECRWGPKKFDFGDPDVLKKIWEVWCCVSNHNENDLPFIRLYRGFETTYESQLSLQERIYMDNTVNQSLVNKVDQKLEPVPRWGVAWYDRSYGPTTLHSLTIVFNSFQEAQRQR
jgi:hypothetical protein